MFGKTGGKTRGRVHFLEMYSDPCFGFLSMGISAWDFRAARNADDTPGMLTAGAGFGFGALGLTPWGAPGSIAYGATSLVMDTPLGEAFKAKFVDGACSATGNC